MPNIFVETTSLQNFIKIRRIHFDMRPCQRTRLFSLQVSHTTASFFNCSLLRQTRSHWLSFLLCPCTQFPKLHARCSLTSQLWLSYSRSRVMFSCSKCSSSERLSYNVDIHICTDRKKLVFHTVLNYHYLISIWKYKYLRKQLLYSINCIRSRVFRYQNGLQL